MLSTVAERPLQPPSPVRLYQSLSGLVIRWAIALVLVLIAGTAHAQEFPRLTILAGLGAMSTGPGHDSATVMETLNFDNSVGNEDRPNTRQLFGKFIQADFGLAPRFGIGFYVGNAKNYTIGQRDNAVNPSLGVELTSQHRVLAMAFLGSYRISRWISVTGGPAVYSVKFALDPATAPAVAAVEETASGWTAGTVVTFTRKRPFVGVISAQYRSSGTVNVPETRVAFGTLAGMSRGDVVWPVSSIRFSHWFVGAGAGIEF